MIGPLPKLYRWRTAAIVFTLFVAVGLWLTLASIPAVTELGALAGALAGVVAAYALLHDFTRPPSRRG
jgi:energy-converting hydrogenase Eha subunit A